MSSEPRIKVIIVLVRGDLLWKLLNPGSCSLKTMLLNRAYLDDLIYVAKPNGYHVVKIITGNRNWRETRNFVNLLCTPNDIDCFYCIYSQNAGIKCLPLRILDLPPI